ncbi:MAG: hypothetical protein LUD18_07145 [Lachnospiraceae bacterium]|nr:hypothetical protein [Lachnospiraceae bacterium]
MKNLIIQLNFPFCFRHCSYCPQSVCKYSPQIMRTYVNAMLREIQAASEDMDDYEVTALSIEGGSPVLAEPSGLQKVLRVLRKQFQLAQQKLAGLGYVQYTIHDFAKPESENRYRLEQLKGTEQLGIGYKAESRIEGVSYKNGHSLQQYLDHSGDLSILAHQLVRLDEESELYREMRARRGEILHSKPSENTTEPSHMRQTVPSFH